MKKILMTLVMVAAMAFTFGNCAAAGKSCNYSLLDVCYDYTNADAATQLLGEEWCFGTWSDTAACSQTNCTEYSDGSKYCY